MSNVSGLSQRVVAVVHPMQDGRPPLGGRTANWAHEQARRVALHHQQRDACGLHFEPAAEPNTDGPRFGPWAAPSDADVVRYWRAKRQAIGAHVSRQAAPPIPTRAPPPAPTHSAPLPNASITSLPVEARIASADGPSALHLSDCQKTPGSRLLSPTDAHDFVWPPSRPAARCAPPSPPLTLKVCNTSSTLQPVSHWSASPSLSSVYNSTTSSDAHTEDGVALKIWGNAILNRNVLYPLRQSKRGDLTYYDEVRQRQILVYRHNIC